MTAVTELIFDHAINEFSIALDGVHLDPRKIKIMQRKWSSKSDETWLVVSPMRYEIRHVGEKPATGELHWDDFEPTDDDYEHLLAAIEAADEARDSVASGVDWEVKHRMALQYALDVALQLVPGWLEPAVKA